MKTIVVRKGGENAVLGIYTTTAATAFSKASAMGYPNASGVMSYATENEYPYGFLLKEVTTDGMSYEEKMHLPGLGSEEVKAGDAVQIVLASENVIIATDNIISGYTPELGDLVAVGANGQIKEAISTSHAIGRVIEVDHLADGNADTTLIKLGANDMWTVALAEATSATL